MKLLILLLITSCGTYRTDYNSPTTQRKIVETTTIGVKCPVDTYYSFKTGLCHFGIKAARVVAILPKKRKIKPVFKASIDCKQVFRDINSCMGGK